MFENINLVAVLVSAVLGMAITSIWYSPLLFGSHWMRAAGLTEENLKYPKMKLARLLGYALVSNLVFFTVLAWFVFMAKESGWEMLTMASLLTALIAAVVVNAVIWEEKPLSYFWINAGYAAVAVYGGMVVLWLWPW